MIIYTTIGQTWNYGNLGPDVWSDTYPSCAKYSQSPINIRTACTTYQSYSSFNFSSYYNLKHNFRLINNGHTILGRYTGNDSLYLTLSGGGLNGTFDFLNFHLHWGENYKSGSEHQINGIKYAGEIHFVYINPETYQLAVLAIFMDSHRDIYINNTDHRKKRLINRNENLTMEEWKKYFSTASLLKDITNSSIINLNITALMGIDLNEFWRYEGSLTTPPCTEGIIWTIFKTPIIFSENELDSFRKNIFFEDYRGPQPLYNRTVYRSFFNATFSLISDYNCCLKNNFENLYNSANQNHFLLFYRKIIKIFFSILVLFYLLI